MNKTLIALAMCAGLTAAPAAAQYANAGERDQTAKPTATDSAAKFNPGADTKESMQGYVKMLKYADCVIGQGQRVDGILTAKPFSRSERDKLGLLGERTKNACPATGFQSVHSLVRGALAEAIYHRQFRQPPAASTPALAQAFVAGEKAFQSERDKGDQTMAGVMSCMVAASPQTAHALLKTTHGSAEEDRAMNAFFAASQACGAGATRPANVSRSFVRAFVADSAWRYGRSVTRR